MNPFCHYSVLIVFAQVYFVDKYLFVNFKAFPQSSGKNALSLAKKIESACNGFSVKPILVVGALDLNAVSKSVSLEVFAQHFDQNPLGAFTGNICVQALKKAGASGSVLNHAEKKLPDDSVKKSMAVAKEESFPVMLCAEGLKRAAFFCSLKPDFIAFEPPELIGGDISVSSASPKIVKSFVKTVNQKSPNTVPIVGAGVKNSDDVKKSLELGAKGVFVASGIVKAQDQKKAVKELLLGFQ